MEGNNNQSKKKMAREDLASMITAEFKESREYTKKLIDEKIEELATSSQEEFLSLKSNIEDVKTGIKDIKADLNKKVDRLEYKELEIRVEKIEEKFKLKPKLKFAQESF